jgi:hypothetical protein
MKKLIALFALLSLSTTALGANVPRLFPDGIAFPALKGLDFSANTNASGMTSEVLTRYEEGSWTPTIIGSTTAGVGTYTGQYGMYVRIGRVVIVQANLQMTAHTGTGAMQISGIPYPSASAAAGYGHCGSLDFFGLTLPANTTALAWVGLGAQHITLASTPVGGGSSNPLAMDTSSSIWITCMYQTN